jgi:hypothetical protein
MAVTGNGGLEPALAEEKRPQSQKTEWPRPASPELNYLA